MKKRFFILSLLLCLALTLLPMNAQAAETSGSCGKNVTWNFDEATGTLTISGTGEMEDYGYAPKPWSNYQITDVVICEGVTEIAALAFAERASITSVTIPDSVTKIGPYAFEDCTNLDSINIPNSVTEIGAFVFQGCTALTSATIPESAFANFKTIFPEYTNLSSVTIAEGVITIPESAFKDCTGLTSVTIPDSVRYIFDFAFQNCSSLTQLYFLSQTSGILIKENAFEGCNKLKELHIKDLETWILCFRFLYNPLKEGMDLYLNGELVTELVIPDGVGYVFDAFNGCTSLTKVTVPGSVKELTIAFCGCPNLKEVILEEGVTLMDSAFVNCEALEKVTIPASVTNISGFDGCRNLKTIVMHGSPESLSGFDAVGATLICTGDPFPLDEDRAFEGRVWRVYYPADNDKWDAEDGWWQEKQHMPFRYKEGCSDAVSGGKHIAIADEFTCTKPITWTCVLCDQEVEKTKAAGHTPVTDEGYAATCTESGLTFGKHCSVCKATLLPQVGIGELGHSLTQGKDSCNRCGENLNLGTWVDGGACGPNVRWDYYSGRDMVISGTGPMYDFTGYILPYADYSDDTSALYICEGVTSIGDYAFNSFWYLFSVSIPDTVSYIGDGAFQMTQLSGVTIPDSVTHLGSAVFRDCENLEAVTLSCNFPTLFENCFAGCEDLKSIIIPEGVNALGKNVCDSPGFSVILNGSQRFTEDKLDEAFPIDGHFYVHTHSYGDWNVTVSASCAYEGIKERTCSCGEKQTETIDPLGHKFSMGFCAVCGDEDPDYVKPTEPVEDTPRVAGGNRFETANLVGDQMKKNLGIEKFDAVVVASGTEFADALAGSYLASTKNAPILLAYTTDKINDGVKDYIRANLKEGGTVYILGGPNAVPTSFEANLEGFEIKRLAGAHRFETNLMVLKEAGIGDKPILVATGLTFADSLSASAAKLPILLVYGDKLLDDQAAFLEENKGRNLYILGGEGAVNARMETVLTAYGTVERVAGNNRFETSVKIAEKFFDSPESAVLAYAWDFPDGLCGGPLAVTMNAPLILTMEKYESQAAAYIQSNTISKATILGGEKLIPDTSVDLIMK